MNKQMELLNEKYHKEAIVAKNLSYCDWIVTTDFSDHIKNHFQKILKSTNSFIMSEDLFEHQEEFIETTVTLDKIRKQSVLDVVPEFKDMFDAYYK